MAISVPSQWSSAQSFAKYPIIQRKYKRSPPKAEQHASYSKFHEMLESDVEDPFNQTQKSPTDLDLTALSVNNKRKSTKFKCEVKEVYGNILLP